MIDIRSVSKSYGALQAVRDISFRVESGEIFGLIGPDGSGKTTLFRMLATLIKPDRGELVIGGLNVVRDYREVRRNIGYMPGRFSLYQDLTVVENLEFFAAVFGKTIEENYRLIEPIYRQIEPFKERRAGALSGGMKQKLALCCALIHKPKVLLLDEPGTGVDPVSRKEFWDMLRELRSDGLTILVSTPYMDEASLCDRIALIQNGEASAGDRPETVINSFRGKLLAARSDDMYRMILELRRAPQVEDCYAFGEYAHVKLDGKSENNVQNSINSLTRLLLQSGFDQVEILAVEPQIEDCFIQYMKQ